MCLIPVLAPRCETKAVGLIESFGAPPQNPWRLRRKNVAGGDPRWGSALDPVGALPQTPFRRGLGAGATSGV